MRQWTGQSRLATRGRGFYPLEAALRGALGKSGIGCGLLHVFLRHTSASLVITENADPDVLRDLETIMSRLAPDGDEDYLHRAEGPDDMAAHIRSVLTLTQVSLPVREGSLSLGTWQGIFLWEHRDRAHQRTVDITIVGE